MEGGESAATGQTSDSKSTWDSNLGEGGHDVQFGGIEDDGDYCRICRGEGTDEMPLFYPCKCSGSIRFVHQDCLMEWLSHSHKKYCELCKTTFRFTKLYDHQMPQTLPLSLFVRQLCLRTLQNAFRWMRYLLVCLVWLAWLPWSIRQVWRALFWLADGSWGIVTERTLKIQPLTANPSIAEILPSFSYNNTHSYLDVVPQTSGILSSFVDFLSRDFLLFKFFRLLYPNLAKWLMGLMDAGASDGNSFLPIWDRQPSFLSEVRYIKYLTSHNNFNSWVMDVLEGQLICLLIVTGFILVFLIREWVINQQPAPDAAGLNGEDLRPVVADQVGIRGPARRQRRRPVDEGREARARRIAVPRPRRRLLPPNPETGEPDAVAPNAESANLMASPEGDLVDATVLEAKVDAKRDALLVDGTSPPKTPAAVRPTLRAPRDSLEDAASIRRQLEENELQAAGLDTFKDLWDRAAGDPTEILRIIREEGWEADLGWVVTKMEKLQQRTTQARTLQTSENFDLDGHEDRTSPGFSIGSNEEVVDPRTLHHTGSTGSVLRHEADNIDGADLSSLLNQPRTELPSSWTTVEEALSPGAEASLPAYVSILEPLSPLPPGETVEERSGAGLQQDVTRMALDTRMTDSPNGPIAIANAAGEELRNGRSPAEAIADWLWQTDGYVPPAEDQLDEDDEHIVADLDEEAPFVRVPQQGTASDVEEGEEEVDDDDADDDADDDDDDDDDGEANQEVDDQLAGLGQEPEIFAAAMADGVDFNAEAMEEAEDLDGLLELIGMQGPLTGMVQNVIFSEVLITLTLAASVWLPYIWGKIGLLLVANPVGVFVRAPLHLLSRLADTTVDASLFMSGTCIYALGYGLDTITPLISAVIPGWGLWVDSKAIRKISLGLASVSGARLEKDIYGTVRGLRPDLPIFSILSHQALRQFEQHALNILEWFGHYKFYLFREAPSRISQYIDCDLIFSRARILHAIHLIGSLYRQMRARSGLLYENVLKLASLRLGVGTPLDLGSLDYSLVRWNTRDRIIAITVGYVLLVCLGYLYIQLSRLLLGLRRSDKIEGIVADSLNQAGGVMKVILIIGIEMIAFPLYCGLLLDIALMPLFEGVGLQSRLAFMANAPLTALFVHWFVGTCYMFHFALFVSMCRRIMRKGVLYFIRDPDDPTFHPIRDVLERPIVSQLRKIAFSGLVYGGLVILCLGGIVLVVSKVHGVFPIRWTSNEPVLEFPIDLLFYNLLLPTVIRTVEPAKKLNAMYEWCFRMCARSLRLTHFLFDEERADEQGRQPHHKWLTMFQQKDCEADRLPLTEAQLSPTEVRQSPSHLLQDGTFVRAPGSDSVRIPKGGRVFLTVDENNNRVDGGKDEDEGPHGKRNKDFVKVYIPSMFRARIAALVFQVWAFAAITGIIFTIVPLSLGRYIIYTITQSSQPPNDLYAFSIGLHLCGIVVYGTLYYKKCYHWTLGTIKDHCGDKALGLPRLRDGIVYVFGLAYMASMFSVILPLVFSIMVELYFVIPLNGYLAPAFTAQQPLGYPPAIPPTIHIIQTWTLGLVYLRAVIRLATSYPHPHSRIATAISSILRDGIWRPNVRLATRAFVLPSLVLSTIMLLAPPCMGWIVDVTFGAAVQRDKVYQYAYPGLLGIALAVYCTMLLKRQIGAWRSKIRDDVYLIGERLHNFGESRRRQKKDKQRAGTREPPVPDRLQIR